MGVKRGLLLKYLTRVTQIPGASSPRQLNFVWLGLIPYMWVLSMKLHVTLVNFEVAARFLENLCTPAFK